MMEKNYHKLQHQSKFEILILMKIKGIVKKISWIRILEGRVPHNFQVTLWYEKGFTFCSISMFVGLMKHLCEHSASADAQAEEILSNETQENNASQTVALSWASNSNLSEDKRDCKENIRILEGSVPHNFQVTVWYEKRVHILF